MESLRQFDFEKIKAMMPMGVKGNKMGKKKQTRTWVTILIGIMIVLCVILGIVDYVYKEKYSGAMVREYDAGKEQFTSQFKARKCNVDLLNAKAENSKMKKSADDLLVKIQKVEGDLSLVQEKIEALTIQLSPIVKEMNERSSRITLLSEQNDFYRMQINKMKNS